MQIAPCHAQVETGLDQSTTLATSSMAATKVEERTLQFSFDRMPWRDVIDWLATSSNLALHVGQLPTGSFTYHDTSSFTPQEALDRINLFLLPEGFTMIRSGQLLSVIDLSDPRSMKQLDSLARLVTVEQLVTLSDHDVVKCIFPLGELNAEEAVEELSALQLLSTPSVFSRTNQLLITDTAGKLKSVRAILNAFQPRTLNNGTVVKTFLLQHVDAEDILVVARPHLGLATDEMIGIDVSLSADLQGRHIFVTGVEDKVKLIESLVTAIDIPVQTDSLTDGDAELRAHLVESGNVETVYNVLQTLLAGKSVRLSTDKAAGTIVALASSEVQVEIADTVTQLQAAEAEFEVIPLKTVDPYFAITLIEQMLDLPDPLAVPASGEKLKGPKIDADPGNMRLFVRGRKHEIEQIKNIVAGLDIGTEAHSEGVRVFPVNPAQAEQLLESAAKFWRSANPIIFYPSIDATAIQPTERIVNEDLSADAFFSKAGGRSVVSEKESPSARLLTTGPVSEEPAIRCQVTARGVLLQSEDTVALDRFEIHLRTVAGPGDTMPSPPIVFYLKYTRPGDAVRMLAELLDGGEAAREGEAGSLVNGYVSSSSGSFMNSLVSSNEGTITMMSGSITVVADSRLNRLIAQGTTSDIDKIEGYLKIIDKDTSITEIETYGRSHVIELSYTRASEVASAVREAYAGRVSGGAKGDAGGGQSDSPEQQARQLQDAAKAAVIAKAAAAKGGVKPGASQPAKDLEPKMTLAVHERSNSLIVTAPEQLFREVEQLVLQIDTRSRQSVEIIKVPEGVPYETLLEMFSGGASISNGKTGTSRASAASAKSR